MFQHRIANYEGQPKWNVKAKMTMFLNTGHPQYGNLREQHVVGDFVYADTAEEAKAKMHAHGDYVWVEVDDGKPKINSWDLPVDDPDYCPF